MNRLYNLNFIYVVVFLVIGFVFNSCKKEEDSVATTVIPFEGSFRINQISVPLDSAIATLDTSTNFSNGYYERSLLIYLFSGNNRLRLIANNWSWHNPPLNGITNKNFMTCSYDSSCNSCIWKAVDHICDGTVIDWLTTPYSYTTVGTKTGYMKVLSNDNINKTVNCIFRAQALNVNGQPDSILADGIIKNLKYTVKT